MASTASSTVVIPGQLLGPKSKYLPGPGTHMHDGKLYSSLIGVVTVSQPASTDAKTSAATAGHAKRLNKIAPTMASLPESLGKPIITVSHGGAFEKRREVLPEIGNAVLCRVVRITPRQAVVAILVCGDTVLDADWQGVIRVQDVRATEKDRVKIYESFRPGDIVRAEVISLGDQANYYLSTARNELGVIEATSEAGNTMYPVSWKEYCDPETGLGEPRKVAKPMCEDES